MSSAVDAINDSYHHPELATQPTALYWGQLETGWEQLITPPLWLQTSRSSNHLWAGLANSLYPQAGFQPPWPKSRHHRGIQIYVDAGSLGTWTLQK